jgi:hypothetical protein
MAGVIAPLRCRLARAAETLGPLAGLPVAWAEATPPRSEMIEMSTPRASARGWETRTARILRTMMFVAAGLIADPGTPPGIG